mmetsp:Transcript_25999/g.40675  ORF Transcript_25999/g.40675 Transcript_25999/m.40675 type:complete len:106 (-) Transcript_25999:199-516(-)
MSCVMTTIRMCGTVWLVWTAFVDGWGNSLCHKLADHAAAKPEGCAGRMFQLLTQFAQGTMLAYGNENKKVSDAPGEDYLFNTEGNNTQNKLKDAGVNVDGWGVSQ